VLPASSGLTLSSTTGGQKAHDEPTFAITGTPTVAGTYSFTLQVTDSSPTPLTQSQTYTISVINPKTFTATANSGPAAITASKSALWFTQQSGTVGVESITTGGTFQFETAIAAATPGVTPSPNAITAGADGYLWVTDNESNFIYRVASNGSSVTPITLQTTGVPPDAVVANGITSASDGGVWFAGQGTQNGYIGRISTDGSNTTVFYPMPQYISNPTGIVADPDGVHLWFLAQAGGTPTIVVGRIKTDGTYDTPAGCQVNPPVANFDGCFILDTNGKPITPPGPVAGTTTPYQFITVGPDGAVWFATSIAELGRIKEDGTSYSFYPVPATVGSIITAPDLAIWFTKAFSDNTLSRITATGEVTTFNVTKPNAFITFDGLTVGPDSALWIADKTNANIVQVFPSLVLNCTVPGALQVGVPISNAACTAVGGKAPFTYSFNTSSLPPGVTVSASGVLSGTPTAPGSFIITANDSSSPAQQATQVISILAAQALQLNCTFPNTGAAGKAYAGSCSTAGGNPPYTYKVTPELPAGLTGVALTPANSTNGGYQYSVTGTLSASLFGTITFTITASDSTSPTASTSAPQTISISVSPVPVSLSCASNVQAVLGRAFQQSCYGTGGEPPYTFAATGLPAGLSISSTTGLIAGTPTALGTSSATIAIEDSSKQIVTVPLTLSVVAPKLALICNVPANPKTGTALSVPCANPGGVGPYSYAVASGSLPGGITFNQTSGVLSGTLTSAGPSTFTLQVTDSESPAAKAQQTVTTFVQPTALTVLSTSIPTPNPPLPYAVRLMVGGGVQPYTFAITAGALPAGLQLVGSTGLIYNDSGSTSIAGGPYTFTVTVTDTAGTTATQSFSGTVPASAISEVFSSYPLPGASGANGITVGPDGNLWFSTLDQAGGNLIGSITTKGTITISKSANALTSSTLANGGDITAGPDGDIWIAQRDGNTVGEITTNQSSQLVYLPTTVSAAPAQVAPAPDGTVWFTETAANQVAHVGPDGTVVEFPTLSPQSAPAGIAVGPYFYIAFTEPGVNKIGGISQDGSINLEFPIPTPNAMPNSIVLGPDSAMWFTESAVNQIGRIDFAGHIVEAPVTAAPGAITLGPDGALYFTEPAANKIGRITVSGAVTELPIPDANSGPAGIVTGPDGSVWFTESNLSRIGRLSFVLGPIINCTLPASPLPALSKFSGTCVAAQGNPPYQFSFSRASGSTPPPGIAIDPKTGSISGTLTTAGTFKFSIVVTDSSTPAQTAQQTFTFTVSPLPLTVACTAPIARLYTPYTGATQPNGCTGVNGTPPYKYVQTTGTLPPGLTFNPATGAISGTPTTLGTYNFTIQATDSSAPVMTASAAVALPVEYGTITSSGKQLFTLSTPPLSVAPGVTTPGLTLTVNQPLLEAVTGTAVLTFTVDPALVGTGLNTPAAYQDPALQFVDGSGNLLTSTYNFTFQPGTSSITLPAMDPGTVLGKVDITISADGLPQTATTFPVAGDTTVIEPGSVQFTNLTSSGFDVEFVAMAPSRTANEVTVTFNPSSGDQITGQQTFNFNVAAISNAWFSSAEGLKYGGRYSLTIPFVFNGNINAIGSATVTLDNSQPVTGNR
jgi:streptogramin lyase